MTFEEARTSSLAASGENIVSSEDNTPPTKEERRPRMDEKEFSLSNAPPVGLFKCHPKPEPFSKNIPRRIFRDHSDTEGVPFHQPPLYL